MGTENFIGNDTKEAKSFIFKIVAKGSRNISSTKGVQKNNYAEQTEHKLPKSMSIFLL